MHNLLSKNNDNGGGKNPFFFLLFFQVGIWSRRIFNHTADFNRNKSGRIYISSYRSSGSTPFILYNMQCSGQYYLDDLSRKKNVNLIFNFF